MAKKLAKRILWLVVLAAVVVLAVRGLREGLHRLDLARYPLKYTEYVEKEAVANGVDPLLIYAVIRTESGFDPAAESHLGARGLMQLMPDAYDWVRMRWGEPQDSDYEALYDPEVGALYGCRMLRLLLDEFETETNALAAYHGGWGSVKQWLDNPDYSQDGENLTYIPFDDTRAYVEKVLKTMEIYRRLYGL